MKVLSIEIRQFVNNDNDSSSSCTDCYCDSTCFTDDGCECTCDSCDSCDKW